MKFLFLLILLPLSLSAQWEQNSYHVCEWDVVCETEQSLILCMRVEGLLGIETEVITSQPLPAWSEGEGELTNVFFGHRVYIDPVSGEGIYSFFWDGYLPGKLHLDRIERSTEDGLFWIVFAKSEVVFL